VTIRRILIGFALLATACAKPSTATSMKPPAPSTISVVATENFWGSLAEQLGGERVTVTNIISNPDTDPHDYEPSPADGRHIASAKYVIANGVGYDAWMTKLLAANPVPGRATLTVGEVVGKKEGDNPHRWYFPGDVETVIARITADYKRIDPKDAVYFDEKRQELETTGLAEYHGLLAEIKQKYANTPVGASESIFVGIAEATGLKLITPLAYLTAISEGTDPTAADKATVDAQIKNHVVKVFVYNSQNATPDVKTLLDAAKTAGIPTPTVTETLTPASVSFEDWQSNQLRDLRDALARAG